MSRCWIIAAAAVGGLVGCDASSAHGPPEVRLGDSVCDECNMIISEERWATATVVRGPRGHEARLFDDFNCQVGHEGQNPDLEFLARWSHDHATGEWTRTEGLTFVASPRLRTPMGSGVAAFASGEDAARAARELGGEAMSFDRAWALLSAADARSRGLPAPTSGGDDGP